MKPSKHIIYTLLLVLLASLSAFVKIDDGDVIKKAATQLNKWVSINKQEKVYLHMDKPYYAIGDDIWFKAYVVLAANHQLSAISGILNVEIIDTKDSIKKAIKLPIISGLTWGDFKLNDSLFTEGNYRIRAYTNYMRNAGDEYFFDKTIHIGNSISTSVYTKVNYTYATQNNKQIVNAVINYADAEGKPLSGKEVSYEVELNSKQTSRGRGITDGSGKISLNFASNANTLFKSGSIITNIKIDPKQTITKTLTLKAISDKIDVQFFPESGYLVNGVRCRVAFKAMGADGLGVNVKGTITDNQNNAVADIEAQHLGMGAFVFTPESGKTYVAKITYPDGSQSTFNLPLAMEKGYVLSIYNNGDDENITLRLSTNQTTLTENQNSEISLVAQSGGNILYAANTKLQLTVFSTVIAKSRFPSGIIQFTLFSGTGEPLNERIIFMQNADQLSLSLNADKGTYAPREKVKLNIQSKDMDGKPSLSDCSLAVIDETKVPVDGDNEGTIFSNILLTSDIKGYVEKPGYYFNNVSSKTKSDLDLLMLTQGYHRFAWKQIMADNFPPLAFGPEKTLDISGTLKTPGGKPISHGKVSLFSKMGGFFYLDTLTDDQGRFAFKNLVFTDSVRFLVQGRTGKDRKNVQIDLDNLLPQLVTKNKNAADVEVNVSAGMANYLQNSKKQYDDFLKYGIITKTHFLKEVLIVEKKQPLKHSDNLNGAGNADQVLKDDDLSTCADLISCLLGKVRFVNFNNGKAYSTRSPNTPMTIVVDGMYVEDDFLTTVNPNDVASVEVLRTIGNTAIYGSRGSGGVLVVTMKRGDEIRSYQHYSPGVITYSPLGYYKMRQFYSPQYDDPKINAKVPDLRTTIFWKPNLITDKDGNASVSFFNADTKGTYRAVIEGIDGNGNIGRQVYRFKVE